MPFNVVHAVGNVLFCLAIGPALVRSLARYRTRFEITWRPARSGSYLEKAQNADGGFGGAPGQGSTALHTGWAGLGLAAAGRNPLDVPRGGLDVLDYVGAHGSAVDDLGAVERTILLYAAAGRPSRIGSRDLVAELVRKRRADGSFAGRVNTTAFSVLAVRNSRTSRQTPVWVTAAGRDPPARRPFPLGAPARRDRAAWQSRNLLAF